MRVTIYLKDGMSVEGIPAQGFVGEGKYEELEGKYVKLLDALASEYEEQEFNPTYSMIMIPVTEIACWAVHAEEEVEEKKEGVREIKERSKG